MEALGRAHLKDVVVVDGYVRGYTDDEEEIKNLQNNIENTSGGFVKNYTRTPKEATEEKEGNMIVIFHGRAYTIQSTSL